MWSSGLFDCSELSNFLYKNTWDKYFAKKTKKQASEELDGSGGWKSDDHGCLRIQNQVDLKAGQEMWVCPK